MSAAYLLSRERAVPDDGHLAPFYCRGKDGFATVDLARKVANAGNRRRDGRALVSYLCGHCRLWHVGHNPDRLK